MEVFGPFISTDNDINILQFCHISCTTLSKKKLHECFREGFVSINSIQLPPGTSQELTKLALGDIVMIRRDTKSLHKSIEKEKIDDISANINIIHVDDHYAIILKESGISAGDMSIFDRSVKQRLFDRTGIQYFKALYHLSKGVRGLMIYAATSAIFYQIARHMIRDDTSSSLPSSSSEATASAGIELVYHSIVCGYLGAEGTSMIINPQDESGMISSLHINIKRVTRCTSTEYLSSISIIPIFHIIISDDASSIIRYLTSYMKMMKNVLRHIGHPIVGDVNMVKRSKGIFIALQVINIKAGIISHDDHIHHHIVMYDKFEKLIMREQAYYDKNKMRDAHLIQASSSSHDDAVDDDDERPVEYVLGRATFCGLSFIVTPDVMIPRKSSETLVNTAYDIIINMALSSSSPPSSSSSSSSYKILDLGTGSGCLLLSLLHKLSYDHHHIRGVGVDISSAALAVAQQNASHLNLSDHVTFYEHDISCIDTFSITYHHNDDDDDGMFEMIICNPPYSSEKEIYRLSSSRKAYEPVIALYSPTGPYGCYQALADAFNRNIIPSSSSSTTTSCRPLLSASGYLVLEIGHGQYQHVMEIFNAISCIKYINIIADHKGINRCLVYQHIKR